MGSPIGVRRYVASECGQMRVAPNGVRLPIAVVDLTVGLSRSLPQRFRRFIRLLPAIEHPKYDARLALDLVVHRVGKAFSEEPMEIEHFHVNAGVELQRVDIGKETVEKIIAEAASLPGVEPPPAVQILERRRQDLDFHSARFRSSRFATSQSMGCSLPAS